MRNATPIALVLACLLSSCASDTTPPDEPGAQTRYLSPTEHLARASMALRGVRPTLEELEAVEADPEWLPAIVDHYLDSPQFGATIRDLHNEALLVQVDPVAFPAGYPAVGELAGEDVQAINVSLAEAPLRLIEHVVTNDLPYGEIVTADYTLADRYVATVWGLPYDADGERWQVTRYQDERPVAGILSDGFLWLRHSSTQSNKSRGRANRLTTALLCYDYLDRQIELDASIDLADDDAVANAIENNESCASCHQTLDPLASYFGDYFPVVVPQWITDYPFGEIQYPGMEGYNRVSFYDPRNALYFGELAAPGFFGQPSPDMSYLGEQIAHDPRFSLCAAQRFSAYLMQRPMDDLSRPMVERFRDVLVDEGMSARELARAIVLSDEFRAAGSDDAQRAEKINGLMKVRPRQLARMVEDLTGYRWRTRLDFDFGSGNIGEIDLMTDGFLGFSVLAGGIDSQYVTRPSHTFNATSMLVLQGLVARAAPFVVERDFAEPDPNRRRLLRLVEAGTTDEASVRAQLEELWFRLYAVRPAPEEIDDAHALFTEVLAQPDADAQRAWTVTVYAMLRDSRIAYF